MEGCSQTGGIRSRLSGGMLGIMTPNITQEEEGTPNKFGVFKLGGDATLKITQRRSESFWILAALLSPPLP